MATISLDLVVVYHQQDTDFYCGGAAAQIVLESIGAGLLSQDDLYDDNNSHNSTTEQAELWYTGPRGLEWTMVNRKPDSFSNTFALFHEDREEKISRKIVWTVYHYKVAPIALVFGWEHWLTVTGCDISAAPKNSADSGYAIIGFFINNSFPALDPADPVAPPPHAAGDTCGTAVDLGIPHEHISYGAWKDDYMTGVPSGSWQDQFLAVCDPLPAPQKHGKQRKGKLYYDGESIINADKARKCAIDGLKEYELAKRTRIKPLLKDVETGNPVLVQKLGPKSQFYYIVPVQSAHQETRALVSVDARFGNYRQSGFAKDTTHPIHFEPMTEAEIKSLLIEKKSIHFKKKVVKIFPETISVYPMMVWKPCAESLSPFWPFHMVTLGQDTIYIRIDGKIFTELRTDMRGI